MVLNIIMAATMYPVILIMYFLVAILGKNNKKYVFGVTLPWEQRESDEVKKITREFVRESWIVAVGTCWIPILAFFTHYVSIQFTIWMVWFLVVLVLIFVPFARANKKTLAIKKIEDPSENTLTYVELKTVRTLKFTDFVAPVILSIIPVVYLYLSAFNRSMNGNQREDRLIFGGILASLALVTIVFVVCALWMDKSRTMVINGNSAINENYSRAKKKLWKKLWLILAYLNTGVVVLTGLSMVLQWKPVLILCIFSGIEGVATIALMIRYAMLAKKIDDNYFDKFEIKDQKDDDRYWKWGMFYCNKKDKRTMVEKRFGYGTTTNMASHGGIACTVFGVLALIWIPFFCIYMIMEDLTPRHLVYEDQKVICKHLKEEYVIDVEDISKVDKLTKLPEGRMKNMGTATDYMEKGKFSTSREGSFYEFLNPEQDIFLRIETEEKIYYVNGNNQEETLEIYNQIKGEVTK